MAKALAIVVIASKRFCRARPFHDHQAVGYIASGASDRHHRHIRSRRGFSRTRLRHRDCHLKEARRISLLWRRYRAGKIELYLTRDTRIRDAANSSDGGDEAIQLQMTEPTQRRPASDTSSNQTQMRLPRPVKTTPERRNQTRKKLHQKDNAMVPIVT